MNNKRGSKLGVFLFFLALVPGRFVFAHDEPLIICDVTVIDAGGHSVEGAQVLVFCLQTDYSGGKPSPEKLTEAYTNVFGQVRLQWPTSESDYFVIAHKPGLSLGWSLVRSWNPRQKIFLQLGEAVPLIGTVVNEDDRPVPNAVVQCKPQSPSEFNFSGFGYDLDLPFLKTQTDKDGRFTFRVMSEDMTTDFYVDHPDYACLFTNASSKAHGYTYRPSQEGIVITLSAGCTIRGKVTDEQGRGVPDVPVNARLPDAFADYRDCFIAVSGRDGSFTLARLPEETFILSTGRPFADQSKWPGFGCMVRTQKDKPTDANIRILKTFPVEFVTIEPKTKRLIPNVQVDAAWLLNSNQQMYYRAGGKTDGSGRLTLPSFPGTCQVTAWADGYNGMWPTPTKVDKNTKRIPIFLNPEEADVSGKVLDINGKPAAGVWVYPLPNMSRTNDLTNIDGSCAMQFQPASKQVYLLAQDIQRNLYALTEVTEDKKEYTLHLQKGLVVKGKVTDENGQPIAGALVGQRCDIPHTSTSVGERVLSNERGEYTFRAVPLTQGPMTYTFEVFASGYGSAEIRKLTMDDSEEEYIVPDIQLIAADCSVRGIVVDDKGNPLPNLFVSLSGSRGSQTANQLHFSSCSDQEGHFFFPRVCRGPIQLQAGWAHEDPGILYACGGDQDLRIIFHKDLVHPEHPSMLDRPLPSLEFGGPPVDPNQIKDKRIAVCFWSMEPKIMEKAFGFSRQIETLDRDNVWACFVSIYPIKSEKREKILNRFSHPVYDSIKWTEMDLLRRTWGAREIPWFVVTDKNHVIIYEGTSPKEAVEALK